MPVMPALPRRTWPLAAIAAGVMAGSWLLIVVAWTLLPTARAVEVVIPPGTAERVARGEIVDAVPRRLHLRRGDTLVVVNEDVTEHRIETVRAPAGRTTRAPITGAFFGAANLLCSFHPSGAIGLDTQARRGLATTGVPALILGLPLSLAAVTTVSVVRRLDVH